MVFSRDTELSLISAVNLINTAPSFLTAKGIVSGEDSLMTLAHLHDFVEREQFSGLRNRDGQELAAVRAMREELRAMFTADEDAAAAHVNALLFRATAVPQLVKHDHWDWHLHATVPAAPLALRIGVEAAMALADVIRSKEMERLKVCAAPDCCALVLDLSKNRSRRYCDTGNCGNRAHVAAYRRRKSTAASGQANAKKPTANAYFIVPADTEP